MDILKEHLHLLPYLRQLVKDRKGYVTHTVFAKNEVTDKTISVVMTTHERTVQTYFTLDTLAASSYKDLQVIIVDDSITSLLSHDRLASYPFTVEYIHIISQNKVWINPCVNYNIAFQYIRGGKVILQNSETCHVGDVLAYVNTHVVDGSYYVFDVKATSSMFMNELIYGHLGPSRVTIDVYRENLFDRWYQHHKENNRMLHFLTACTTATFRSIGGFSYDYAFGKDYDDDDLLLRIHAKGYTCVCVPHEEEKIGGIHQWHSKGEEIKDRRAYFAGSNDNLFYRKQAYLKQTGLYFDISETDDLEEMKQRWEILCRI